MHTLQTTDGSNIVASSLCDDAGDRRCDERPGAHGCLNSSSCTQRSWQHIRNLWWTSSATDACSKYQPAQHFTFVMLTIYCQVLALKQFLRALSHLCGESCLTLLYWSACCSKTAWICEQNYACTVWVKKSPPRLSEFFSFFHKRLRIFNRFFRLLFVPVYATDDKFLFSYLQLWQSYAILSATT